MKYFSWVFFKNTREKKIGIYLKAVNHFKIVQGHQRAKNKDLKEKNPSKPQTSAWNVCRRLTVKTG